MRRSAIDRPRLLNNAGERLIAEAYADRSRKQMSWGDCAETVIFTLNATGLLRHYEEPGIDALATIQAFNSDEDRE
jgi:hypothetical protein